MPDRRAMSVIAVALRGLSRPSADPSKSTQMNLSDGCRSTASCPLFAHSCPAVMSAMRSQSRVKRTCRGHENSVAVGPKVLFQRGGLELTSTKVYRVNGSGVGASALDCNPRS